MKKQKSYSTMSLNEVGSSNIKETFNYCLCLKQVPADMTVDALRDWCSKFGKVININQLPFLKFVAFATLNEMENALIGMKNNPYGIKAVVATTKTRQHKDDTSSEKGFRVQSFKENKGPNSKNTPDKTKGNLNKSLPMRNQVINSPNKNREKDYPKVEQNTQRVTMYNNSAEEITLQNDEMESSIPSSNNGDSSLCFCVLCGEHAKKMCQRCGDFYCSQQCQRMDFHRHRFYCFPLPYLVNIHQNMEQLVQEPVINGHLNDLNEVHVQHSIPSMPMSVRPAPGQYSAHPMLPPHHVGYQNYNFNRMCTQNMNNIYQGPPLHVNSQQMTTMVVTTNRNMSVSSAPTITTPQNSPNWNKPIKNTTGIKESSLSVAVANCAIQEKPQSATVKNFDQNKMNGVSSTSTLSSVAVANCAIQEKPPSTTVKNFDQNKMNKVSSTSTLSSNTCNIKENAIATSVESNKGTIPSQRDSELQKKSSDEKTSIPADIGQNKESVVDKTSNDKNRIPVANFPKNGSIISITAALKPYLVCIRAMDGNSNIEYVKTVNLMNSIGRKSKKIETLPKIGDIVLAEYYDRGFNRGLVLRIQSENEIFICFPDFGDVAVKKLPDLSEAPKEAFEMPRYALPARLKGIPEDADSKDAMDYLNSYTDCLQDLKIVYDAKDENIEVEIFESSTNECLNKTVLDLIKKNSK